MINIRSLVIVLSFLTLSVSLIIISSNISTRKKSESGQRLARQESVTKFKKMSYFLLDNGKEQVTFDATELNIVDEIFFEFTKPVGLYNTNTQPFSFESDEGTYSIKSGTFNFKNSVVISNATSEYQADTMLINGPSNFVQASGNIKAKTTDQITKDQILVNASKMSSWVNENRTIFEGNIKGLIKRKRSYEKGLNFESDVLEFIGKESQLNLSGNVKLKRNSYDLRANKAEIFLENFNKRLKYYALYDDIELTERFRDSSGVFQTRRAYSEKLEGFISSSKIVLSGAPRVEQKNDIIKGNQITLREKVQLIEVDDSKSFFRLKDKETR